MRRRVFSIGALVGAGAFLTTASAADRAAWMKEARFGVMTHFISNWIRPRGQMTIEEWNRLIDNFDVEGLAKQLESVGAAYYLITLGQGASFYIAPNPTFDKYVPAAVSRCARRDLVSDLYGPLHKRGIRLMVYSVPGPPLDDPAVAKGFRRDSDSPGGREVRSRWQEVVRDWSMRWGDKVCGWWIDGLYTPNRSFRAPDPPNFASFVAALRAGNPASIVAFNGGVMDRAYSITPEEDYTAGEVEQPANFTFAHSENGKIDGAQVHMLTYLGKTWGRGEPRFSTEQVVEYSRKVADAGGAVTWDTPVQENGLISGPALEQLRAIGKALGRR